MAHWHEDHKTKCEELSQRPNVVRGIIRHTAKESRFMFISAETLMALNDLTGVAHFTESYMTNDLYVEFGTPSQCEDWCNIMNLVIFPDQQGVVPLIREGVHAAAVGATFRMPMGFQQFLDYIGEGRIFYHANKWEHRNMHKTTGRWEEGYGIEPIQNWIDRQVHCLARGLQFLDDLE